MTKLTKLSVADVNVPADVPEKFKTRYAKNYLEVTRATGRLMLFAGDQKIEHLNDDFYGSGIAPENNNPEHLFKIAAAGQVGLFATQYGLIARYGRSYPDLPYLVKLNSKTNAVSTKQSDPYSSELVTVDQALSLARDGKVSIRGFGYTVYIGSEYETQMLREAAQIIHAAHQQGLLVVLWMYPRGRAVTDEFDPHLIAGAAGVGACLGADFVKVNIPKSGTKPIEDFKEAITAAGRTGVITAGGSSKPVKEFLQQLSDVMTVSGAAGNATGRNIHQKSLPEAVRLTQAIAALTYTGVSVDEAYKLYSGR